MSNTRETGQRAADNPWVFMGFDLRQIPALWFAGWKEALSWPLFAWLKVSPIVRVYYPDGARAYYANGQLSAQETSVASRQNAAFHALILPERILLSRAMVLPKMSTADLQQTLQFEVDAVTPFDPAQTVWGYRIDDQQWETQRVDLVLSSRAHIERLIGQMALPVGVEALELWGMNARSQPIGLIGYAEQRRKRYIRSRIMQIVSLLLMIPLLVLAIASVPMVAAQIRLSHAKQAMATLESKSGMVEAQRSELLAQSQSGQVVLSYLKTIPQPLFVLNLLSKHIPDTAYLERFDMNIQRTLITGQADNAAALTQILGALPELQNVHAPSAITRNPQNNKERFTLEFTVNPEPAHE